MDITRDTIDRILELDREATVLDPEGRPYILKGVYEPLQYPMPEAVHLQTLSGLVGFYGYAEQIEDTLVHVRDHQEVALIGASLTGPWRKRAVLAVAALPPLDIMPDGFLPQSEFMLRVQTCFVQNDELGDLLRCVGNLKADAVGTSVDDGVTQTATFRSGVASSAKKEIRSVWDLQPFVTWPELEQPTISYILRLKGREGEEPRVGLFPTSDLGWRNEARSKTVAYLKGHLPEAAVILA